MPFKIEKVETMLNNGPNIVKFIGSNQKLHGAEQMLRAHVKAEHTRLVNIVGIPNDLKDVSQDWIDKIDTIELQVAADGTVSFGGTQPKMDYYRILPVTNVNPVTPADIFVTMYCHDTEEMHKVVGPFDDMDAANAWIEQFDYDYIIVPHVAVKPEDYRP